MYVRTRTKMLQLAALFMAVDLVITAGGSLKAEGLGDGSTVFVSDHWQTDA